MSTELPADDYRVTQPLYCPIHRATYHFSEKGLPHIHQRYFCEHIWWCNVCVTWCHPGMYCFHDGTIPEWAIVLDREQRYYLAVHENSELRQLVRDYHDLLQLWDASVTAPVTHESIAAWEEKRHGIQERAKKLGTIE